MSDAMGQETPPSAAFFQMYDEEDAEPGFRPPRMGEPLALDKIQRGTAQIEDHTFNFVQILNGSVPGPLEMLVLGATPAEQMSEHWGRDHVSC